VPAKVRQSRGQADLPGTATIDWKGVAPVKAAPAPHQAITPIAAPAEPAPPEAIDADEYMAPQSIENLRPDEDDSLPGAA